MCQKLTPPHSIASRAESPPRRVGQPSICKHNPFDGVADQRELFSEDQNIRFTVFLHAVSVHLMEVTGGDVDKRDYHVARPAIPPNLPQIIVRFQPPTISFLTLHHR
jgi:hypothetical protein